MNRWYSTMKGSWYSKSEKNSDKFPMRVRGWMFMCLSPSFNKMLFSQGSWKIAINSFSWKAKKTVLSKYTLAKDARQYQKQAEQLYKVHIKFIPKYPTERNIGSKLKKTWILCNYLVIVEINPGYKCCNVLHIQIKHQSYLYNLFSLVMFFLLQ